MERFSRMQICVLLDGLYSNKKVLDISKQAEKHVVMGDSSSLQNSIMNLGINSSSAMPDGGKLEIKTSNRIVNSSFCDLSPFDIKSKL